MDFIKIKIELIRKIHSFHPAYDAGIKRGWSTYVGGMTDTGEWNFWKMYDASIEELEQCLAELEEESKPKDYVLSEQDKIDLATPTAHQTADGQWIYSNVYCDRCMKKLLEKQIRSLLWGTK